MSSPTRTAVCWYTPQAGHPQLHLYPDYSKVSSTLWYPTLLCAVSYLLRRGHPIPTLPPPPVYRRPSKDNPDVPRSHTERSLLPRLGQYHPLDAHVLNMLGPEPDRALRTIGHGTQEGHDRITQIIERLRGTENPGTFLGSLLDAEMAEWATSIHTPCQTRARA